MKRRLILTAVMLFLLPALACSAPARILSSRRATSTPTPLPTAVPTATQPPEPSATPAPTTAAQSAVGLVDHVLQENNDADQYEIKGVFPYLPTPVAHMETFNTAMQEFEDATLSAFRADAATAAAAPSASTGSFLQSRYEVLHNQNDLLSLRIWISIYMKGAAHPGSFSKTFNFDLSTGRMLALDDLFQPGADYLPLLSQFCQAEILRRDSQFWPDGADPQPANYRSWNLTPGGLLVTFDEYQVAPYAAGPQSVMVPYSELSGVLLPNGPASRALP